MNPSRSDTSNTNAKKEDIPISMPNIQLPFIISNNCLNLPIIRNTMAPNSSSLFVPNQILLNNYQPRANQNIQMIQPSSQPGPSYLNPLHFSRINSTTSNAGQVNNIVVRHVDSMFANMSLYNNIQTRPSNDSLSTNRKSNESLFTINCNGNPALSESIRRYQTNLTPNSLNGPEPIQLRYPLASGSETNQFDNVIGPHSDSIKTGPNPEEVQSTSDQSGSASTSRNWIKVSPDGKVTNIPGSMLRDQYGIVGELLTMVLAKAKPHLTELNVGRNLMDMGMGYLNSPENVLSSFGGPFAEHPLGPHQRVADVPPEYRLSGRLKLPEINLRKIKDDDLMFYLFYTYYQEEIQLFAASQLYQRGWRYHKVLRVWITPVSNDQKVGSDNTCVEGTFRVFDTESWRPITKKMFIVYSDLEDTNETSRRNQRSQPPKK